MKKYKLTDESIVHNGYTLYRIECINAFGDVKVGDKGGWLEKEDNLDTSDNAWVSGDAMVFGDAWVTGNACVSDNAMVFGDACIYGDALVSEDAMVFGNAKVSGNALVFEDAMVFGNARVSGNALVYGNSEVFGNALVSGNACVSGKSEISGNAEVNSDYDYMVFKNSWSSGRYFTWTKSNNMWKVGCFYGTGEELIRKAYDDSELKGKCYEKVVNFVKELEEIKNNC